MNKKMQDLCQWAMKTAKKAGAKNSRATFAKSRFVEIRHRDRHPEIIKQATTNELTIELFVDGRYSLQNTCDLRKDALKDFITESIAATKLLAEDPYRTLPEPKYYQGRADIDLKTDDSSIDDLTPEQKHAYVTAAEEAAWSKDSKRIISVEAGFNDDANEAVTLTTNGFSGYNKSTSFSGYVSVNVKDDDERRPEDYDYAATRMRAKLEKPETIGDNAAKRALAAIGAKKIETGAIPVIIENRIVPRLMNGLFAALSGQNIYQKRSFLADKKGHKIGSDKLTLVDDPFVPEGLGSRLFDGDGFAARKRTVFEAGVLKDFYIDWYYSRKLGCEPTSGGHANMIIPAGNRTIDEIMKDLGKGILITSFLGGNSNSTTGDFSIGIFGQLFENGKVIHPVSEMNIADNHLKFWNKLAECANDPWLYSDWQTPSLVFTDIVVSGV
jgi:PmbA protein